MDKEEARRLNLEEFRDNGWFLFQVSGVVTDLTVPTVNLQFYRKNVSDQEVGAVLVSNQAWKFTVLSRIRPPTKLDSCGSRTKHILTINSPR